MSGKRTNHYQILGVKPHVSSEEIKRAYRELVKSRHPDFGHANRTEDENASATEEMRQLNEAYETLMDVRRRKAYDIKIGVSVIFNMASLGDGGAEEDLRETYLRQIFHPSRLAIYKILNLYDKQVKLLSQDPYDDDLIADFVCYADKIEETLRCASQSIVAARTPGSLEPAVLMFRHSIAQAVDGLEEIRRYCLNFDYNHLSLAESLFKIAKELSKESLDLSKSCR